MSDPETLLDCGVTARRTLQGGDLSKVVLLSLSDGRQVVAKCGPLVQAEGRMLQTLARARIPVPKVLASAPGLLIMTYLPAASAAANDPDTWARLGTTLRRMHDTTAGDNDPSYGWSEPYAFGPVAIPAASPAEVTDWPGFWAQARMLPALPHLPADMARQVETLCHRLPEDLPARPRPGLLHGDLWHGNLLFGPQGSVHLIDPACCYGDGEVDIAMLHLFGKPGQGFWSGYGALPEGWKRRMSIYQLWPALVHLQLFGSGYLPLVASRLNALGI
ncbi:fructosamine kinase family protein [Pseudooceanicola sp. HF7]|uniref:fructosamine kinase family protein n=1 Tax=Pseudooceanicola sp. HF7 TaxID=2721560 RepID=UPI00142F825C|nr:fructosamine kinase family protein [Pseudooceanicola sp. HF7]NIZ09014.1 fructosamine kinase family protein [Pseudooceanicola sp. HF7]